MAIPFWYNAKAMFIQKKISKQDRKLIDSVMLVAASIYPLTVLPQIHSIYTTHDVSGLSLSTWIGFMLFGVIFLLYAIIHKLKPNIISQIIWFSVDLVVVVGILLYR